MATELAADSAVKIGIERAPLKLPILGVYLGGDVQVLRIAADLTETCPIWSFVLARARELQAARSPGDLILEPTGA